LKRGDQEDYLRQQTFEVLLYLVEQRERLVSKDELIGAVWRGTAVTDNALAQCIVEIRKALGDDSRQPRFVKTIPKFGYRFIAPVEERSSRIAPLSKQESNVVQDPKPAENDSAAVSVASPEPTVVLPKRRAWFNRKLIATGIVAALLLLILIWLIVRHQASIQASQPALKEAPGKKSLAVLYFDNQSSRPDMNWLSQGLAEMLIADLSRSEKLNVLGSEQLYWLWKSAGRLPEQKIPLAQALEIARQSHAETVIRGSFATVDQRVRIDVQLYGSRDGHLLGGEHVTADNAAETLSQVDVLAQRLAGRLSGKTSLNSSLPQTASGGISDYR
jgi:DNA-binding winged helix-turn-helix (wHTH) protein/TolB-like protein